MNVTRGFVRSGIRSPAVRLCFILVPTVIMLLLSIWSTHQANVAFTLRVSGTSAVLSIDGRVVAVPWPRGISGVEVAYQDPNYRLFQVDGSTMSNGVYSYDGAAFAPVAGTFYYRFLCWLRDCSSYSAWGHLSVRDDSKDQVLLNNGTVAALPTLTLPAAFTLRGTFSRPERASSLQFKGSSNILLTIDPEGREVAFGGIPIYFPKGWAPFLALVGWTITRSYLFGVVLLLTLLMGCMVLMASLAIGFSHIAAQFGTRWSNRPATLLGREWSYITIRRVIWWGATGVILTALLAISDLAYFRLPRISDEVAYYFQAMILRTGNFSVTAPSANLAAFFPGPFLDIVHGRWFASYPPGAPMAYALGMLFDAPWIINPILGAATAYMMARLACRWYGEAAGLLCFALVGLSPFFLFLASSYMSHAACLFFLLLLLSGMDLLEATGAARWGCLASLGLGLAFLTREYSTFLFALPVGAIYGARWLGAMRRRGQLRPISGMTVTVVALIVPALLCYAFYVFYNWRLSGVVQIIGRATIGSSGLGASGSGAPGEGSTTWTPASGLFVVDNLYSTLLIQLFGWPYYLTLSFFFLPLATLRLRSHDLLLYGIAGGTLAGYGLYYANGIAFGPRYLFESLPAYIILTARGLLIAGDLVQTGCGRAWRFLKTKRIGVPAACLALAVLMGANCTFYLPRQFPLYTAYLGHGVTGGSLRADLSGLHNALVISNNVGAYRILLFPLNDPSLRGTVVYAATSDWTTIAPLVAAYPARTIYTLDFVNEHAVVHPVGPEILYGAAVHAQQAKDFPSDLAVLRRLLVGYPDYKQAEFGEGWALWNLGQKEPAIAAYRRYVKRHPQDAQAQLNLGYSLIVVKQCTAAIAPLRTVLKLEPSNTAARRDLAICGSTKKT